MLAGPFPVMRSPSRRVAVDRAVAEVARRGLDQKIRSGPASRPEVVGVHRPHPLAYPPGGVDVAFGSTTSILLIYLMIGAALGYLIGRAKRLPIVGAAMGALGGAIGLLVLVLTRPRLEHPGDPSDHDAPAR